MDQKAGLSPAARLWRINRGRRRSKNKLQLGFIINPISGQWSKQDEPDVNSAEREEAASEKIPNQRIVPFVENHRNILIPAPRLMHFLPGAGAWSFEGGKSRWRQA